MGDQLIWVMVLSPGDGGVVRLGFEADISVQIDREEVYMRKQTEGVKTKPARRSDEE